MNDENYKIKDFFIYEYEKSYEKDIIKDISELMSGSHNYEKFVKISNDSIEFKHFVGLLQTKNYEINILPKVLRRKDINNNERGQIDEETKKILMEMFLYAFLGPDLFKKQTKIKTLKPDTNLFELLINFFSTTLEMELNQGIYRNYNRKEIENKYLNGRINLRKQISKINKTKFDVTIFKFSSNNNLNRFFLYATSKFLNLTRNKENRNSLQSILSLLIYEDLTIFNVNSLISFNRLNKRFEIPYNYANIILEGLVYIGGENKSSMMYLFDMNKIFEMFFFNLINNKKKEIFGTEDNISIRAQNQEKNFIYEDDNPKKYTRPDIIIDIDKNNENKKLKIIIDTKYKILDGIKIEDDSEKDDIFKISESDIYQAFTYSEVYNPEYTILVYPRNPLKESEYKKYRFKKDGKFLIIFLFRLDFSVNWEENMSKDLKNFFDKLFNSD
ncbi:MAG: McrC family protein [Thermoplasmata archaeon]